MVNGNKLNNLYETIINGEELTTTTLKKCGFNSNEINCLIENSIIKRIRRGYYSYLDVESLFSYGKSLLDNKEYEKANQCFEVCYKFNPKHSDVCFRLFLNSLRCQNYDNIMDYFDGFYGKEDKFCNQDSNLYLYLLSMIIELPEKHKDYARFMNFYDIRVLPNDSRYENIIFQNNIRKAIFNQKFPFALSKLNDLKNGVGKRNIQNYIIRLLLKEVLEIQKDKINTIINLIEEREYTKIIEGLECLEKTQRLSSTDSQILDLTNKLITIIESKQIPEIGIRKTDNLSEAIEYQNYELALSLCKEYNEQHNIENDKSVIYLLLRDINEEIMYLENPDLLRPDDIDCYQESDDYETKYAEDEAYINGKIDDLIENGILILEPMDDERIERIHKIINTIYDIVAFDINIEDKKQIVLRFKPRIFEKIDIEQLNNYGNDAYKNGDYDECIRTFRTLLEFGTPKPFVYVRLGLAYMKNGENKLAIDYLTVAMELSKFSDKKYDFTEIINELKCLMTNEDIKKTEIEKSDFEKDGDRKSEDVEEIINLINLGVSFEDACLQFALDEEKKSVVLLYLARSCYINGNYDLGDEYMDMIVKNKTKTKSLTSLFSEIGLNRQISNDKN